jgi:lactate dehydrogenase-like 2-hydroxyacid dehydrogenase
MKYISVLIHDHHIFNILDKYNDIFEKYNIKICNDNTNLDKYDVYIITDDVALRDICEKYDKNKLKIIFKLTNNCNKINEIVNKNENIKLYILPFSFYEDFADIIIGYLIMLNNKLNTITNYKSLSNKKVCIIGYNKISQSIIKKLSSLNMNIYVYDGMFGLTYGERIYNKKTYQGYDNMYKIKFGELQNCMQNADFIIVACELNENNRNLINKHNLCHCNKGVKIINMFNSGIIDETDVLELVKSEQIDSIAFQYYESESLKKYDKNFANIKINLYPDGIEEFANIIIKNILNNFCIRSKI